MLRLELWRNAEDRQLLDVSWDFPATGGQLTISKTFGILNNYV